MKKKSPAIAFRPAPIPRADGLPSTGTPHADGWGNLLTGLDQKNKDRRRNLAYTNTVVLQFNELTDIYRAEGIGKRIVDLPVSDMTRQWFTVTGDTENKVLDYLRKMKAKKAVIQCLKWARLYGGCLGIMGIDDGGDYEAEVNVGAIRSVKFIHTYHRHRITVNTADTYTDSAHEKFGMPQWYTISPIQGTPFRVHDSRVLRFDGEDVPDIAMVENNGWADSIIQSAYTRLSGLGEAYHGLEHIVSEFVIGVMKIEGLQEMIAAGRESKVITRLNLLDISKHIINSVMLDTREDFQRMGQPVAGLAELVRTLIQGLSAVTGIPVTLLMGESPAGLNATGASDIRLYYDNIKEMQEEQLLPQMEQLINLVFMASDSGIKAPASWQIEFKPLWQPTEKEVTETRNIQAQIDASYIDRQVVSPEEVRKSRFGGDQYSHETEITGESVPTPVGDGLDGGKDEDEGVA